MPFVDNCAGVAGARQELGDTLEITADQAPGTQAGWRLFVEAQGLGLAGWSRLQPQGLPDIESGIADLSLWLDFADNALQRASANVVIDDLSARGSPARSPFGLQGSIEYSRELGGFLLAVRLLDEPETPSQTHTEDSHEGASTTAPVETETPTAPAVAQEAPETAATATATSEAPGPQNAAQEPSVAPNEPVATPSPRDIEGALVREEPRPSSNRPSPPRPPRPQIRPLPSTPTSSPSDERATGSTPSHSDLGF